MMRPLIAAGIRLVFASSILQAQVGSSRPQVWMMPPADQGGRCFRELFAHPDLLEETRSRVNVIGYADHNLNRQFTDGELRTWMEMLNKWDIRFALEVGAVKPWDVTGEATFQVQHSMWDRFQSLGARTYAIAMDEPLCCVRKDLKKADEYAVEQTAQFVARVRRKYPGIRIGDIKPYPFISLAGLTEWIDALENRLSELEVAGLDFFRLDVD